MSRPCLITGDRGFIGSRLRSFLLEQGHEVVGVGRTPPQDSHPRYHALTLDLSVSTEVRGVAGHFRDAAAVFHLAGRIPQGADEALDIHLAANLRTTENVIQALDGSGVPLVISSTMYVYGQAPQCLPVTEEEPPRPVNAYGITKLAAEVFAERIARAGRVPCVVLRYPGVFGLGSDVALELYATRALAGNTVRVYGSGKIIRDYVHVDDVVAANLLAAEAAPRLGWGLYHVGSGERRSLAELAQWTVEAAGSGRVETEERPGPFDFVFDITRARRDLGYAPEALQERVRAYVEELRSTLHP